MTRILYWNIENFSLNKINNPTKVNESQDRLDYIRSVVQQCDPDIFVIVEVATLGAPLHDEGTIIPNNQSGSHAVQILLQNINYIYQGHKTWCLVPPLNSGNQRYREVVAVYYKSNDLQFIGPYVYAKLLHQVNPLAQNLNSPGVINNLANYDDPWKNFANGNRKYNGVLENQFAGQWEFYNQSGNRIYFPDHIPKRFAEDKNPPGMNRSPFLTSFLDLHNNRIIKLLSVHTSPDTAEYAVNNLTHIREVQNVVDNEVSVIVGDFNVDTFDEKKNGAYIGLLNLGYTLHLDPRDDTVTVNQARKPYCMTHLLPTEKATPFNATGRTDPQHNVYPRFGYMGSMGGDLYQIPSDYSGAIDNIFTKYGRNINPPANHNMTIVNTVTRKPYNALGNNTPQGVTAELTGGLNINQTIVDTGYPVCLAANLRNGRGFDGNFNTYNMDHNYYVRQFRDWDNFAKIRSVSDHLALCIDV
jgi:hypothetical protein